MKTKFQMWQLIWNGGSIYNLQSRHVIDVDQFLNYSSQNNTIMESSTDEKIVQEVMDMLNDDDQNLYDNCVLLNISLKNSLSVIKTLKFTC